MVKETAPKFLDEKTTVPTCSSLAGDPAVELILDEEERGVDSAHPYSVIPPLFDARRQSPKDSRRVLSVETWDGRSIMSMETEG